MGELPEDQGSQKIQQLLDLNEELENYFRNTIIPQIFVDANLILRKFTPPAMKQFDLQLNHLGRPLQEVLHHIRFPTFLNNIQEVIDSGEDLEKEIQTTDLKWFQMNILPYKVGKENKLNGVLITFIDITARIQNLKEIEKINADHETFIYSVSHDLRGPVSNLEELIRDLQEATVGVDMETREVVDMVDVSVAHIKKIILELADVAKTRHDLSKGAERISLENILEEVQLTLKDMIKKSGTVIKTQIEISEINFIRKNLRSIIYNCLSNAIKYKSEKAPQILIRTEKLEDYILLSISDNGIGIQEDQKMKIFDEFSRANDDVEGTGIGLYIVSKIMQNSGGKIEVESNPGKGTTFNIYFKS